MKKPASRTHARGRRPGVLAAMVLGTALSALAPASQAAGLTATPTATAITDISRYCTVCWRNARLDPVNWADCTQEVFCRLLERVAVPDWSGVLREDSAERREFLRAIDAVKKRTQRSRKWAAGTADQADDRRDQHERSVAEDREAVHRAAHRLLTPRQQQILRLCQEGWSVQEIASELAVPAARVSDEKYKAIGKLRDHFAAA